MRRIVAIACAASLLATPTAHAFSQANRHRFCRYESLNGQAGFTQYEVRDTIACAVTKFSVPGGYGTVLYIAERESGLYPHAVSPTGCCLGIYQQNRYYWAGRVAAFRQIHPRYRISGNVFDARSNVLVSVWMMHRFGLGAWS